jgi:uncharacterized protein (DUF1697 family)
MTTFIALLRAVNVGGTGKLPMTELKAMCVAAGFSDVRTYIASGNVVFQSGAPAAKVTAALEQALHAYAGKPVKVFVRSAAEMARVLAANPFPDAAPNRTVTVFLDHAPAADTASRLSGQNGEQVELGRHEIYIHYGDGMGQSKLKVPGADAGTARNMNTVAKLLAMAAGSAN